MFVFIWNMKQFREKIDILSVTHWLKLESKNPFAKLSIYTKYIKSIV